MKHIVAPDEILLALQQGAAMMVNVSGGKDSQALARALMPLRSPAYTGEWRVLHATLGRMDWPETQVQSRRIAESVGLPFSEVKAKTDLLAAIEARKEKLKGTGKPFWPSAEQRYCTAYSKRTPSDKFMRAYSLVISAEGIRAEESRARARKEPLSIRENITSTKQFDDGKRFADLPMGEAVRRWIDTPGHGRLALTWYPIFDWTLDEVWIGCGTTREDVDRRRALYAAGKIEEALEGWSLHPGYIYGNNRISCAMCVLASNHDLMIGSRHNPELAQKLLGMEEETGLTFKHKWSLRRAIESAVVAETREHDDHS